MKRAGIIFLLILPLLSQAQIGGTTIFNSLDIQPSARVAAMGGSFNAVKDGDIQLASVNPSLIDSSMAGNIAVSYVDYFAKTNFGNASYAHKIRPGLTAAASVLYIGHGKMDEYDSFGNNTGTFNAGEFSLILGAGYAVDSLWTVGVNLKTLYANIAEYSSLGLAVDLAATYHRPEKNFTATFVMRNAGVQLKTFTPGQREKFPFEFQMGLSKKPIHAPFRFSVMVDNLQKWDLTYVNPNGSVTVDPLTGELVEDRKFEFGDKLMRHITAGAEFILSDNFQVQGAYNYRRRQELKLEDKPGMTGFSFGLSFRIKRFQLAYGRAIYHLAGPSNHFTFGFKV